MEWYSINFNRWETLLEQASVVVETNSEEDPLSQLEEVEEAFES